MAEQERPLKSAAEIHEEQSRINRCDFSRLTTGLHNYYVKTYYSDDLEETIVVLERSVLTPSQDEHDWQFSMGKEQVTVFSTKNSIEARYAIREAEDAVMAARRMMEVSKPNPFDTDPDDIVDATSYSINMIRGYNKTRFDK